MSSTIDRLRVWVARKILPAGVIPVVPGIFVYRQHYACDLSGDGAFPPPESKTYGCDYGHVVDDAGAHWWRMKTYTEPR